MSPNELDDVLVGSGTKFTTELKIGSKLIL